MVNEIDLEVTASSADASLTVPLKAGDIKKGTLVMIKGFPCKVTDTSTSKTGKHGHAKINYVGLDIFTDKKYEDMAPTSHNVEAPIVRREEYQLLDVRDDGHVEVMDANGGVQTIRMLEGEEDKLRNKLLTDLFNAEKDVLVGVIYALNKEAIVSVREKNQQ